jgi:hypothetical protein
VTSEADTNLSLTAGLFEHGPLGLRSNTTKAIGEPIKNYTISSNVNFTSVCYKILGRTQGTIFPAVKQQGRVADHSFSAEVKNGPYVFMAWCLIK